MNSVLLLIRKGILSMMSKEFKSKSKNWILPNEAWYCAASFLDVRFKSFMRLTTTVGEQKKKLAIKLLTEMIGQGPEEIQRLLVVPVVSTSQQPSQTISAQNVKKPNDIILPRLQYLDAEIVDSPVGKTAKIKKSVPFQQEIEKYSAVPYSSSAPEAWWKLNGKDYPALCYCASRILNIPGSSVPTESLFSEAADQVTTKRNRLDPQRVDKMMVVEQFYTNDHNSK